MVPRRWKSLEAGPWHVVLPRPRATGATATHPRYPRVHLSQGDDISMTPNQRNPQSERSNNRARRGTTAIDLAVLILFVAAAIVLVVFGHAGAAVLTAAAAFIAGGFGLWLGRHKRRR